MPLPGRNALYNLTFNPHHKITAGFCLMGILKILKIIPVLHGSCPGIGCVMHDDPGDLLCTGSRSGIGITVRSSTSISGRSASMASPVRSEYSLEHRPETFITPSSRANKISSTKPRRNARFIRLFFLCCCSSFDLLCPFSFHQISFPSAAILSQNQEDFRKRTLGFYEFLKK